MSILLLLLSYSYIQDSSDMYKAYIVHVAIQLHAEHSLDELKSCLSTTEF